VAYTNDLVPEFFVALTATPILRNGIPDILALVHTINLFYPRIHDPLMGISLRSSDSQEKQMAGDYDRAI